MTMSLLLCFQIEILPFKEHKPADFVTVVVRTDQGDKVALAAVDTAVYILNKNNKLTPQKVHNLCLSG